MVRPLDPPEDSCSTWSYNTPACFLPPVGKFIGDGAGATSQTFSYSDDACEGRNRIACSQQSIEFVPFFCFVCHWSGVRNFVGDRIGSEEVGDITRSDRIP